LGLKISYSQKSFPKAKLSLLHVREIFKKESLLNPPLQGSFERCRPNCNLSSLLRPLTGPELLERRNPKINCPYTCPQIKVGTTTNMSNLIRMGVEGSAKIIAVQGSNRYAGYVLLKHWVHIFQLILSSSLSSLSIKLRIAVHF